MGKFAFNIAVHGQFDLLQQDQLWRLVMEMVLFWQADSAWAFARNDERAIGWATKLAHCALLLNSSGLCERTCAPHPYFHAIYYFYNLTCSHTDSQCILKYFHVFLQAYTVY